MTARDAHRTLAAAGLAAYLALPASSAVAAVRASPVIGGTTDPFVSGRTYGGALPGDRAGRALALLGDVDSDRRVDAAIGSPGADGGRGVVRVVAAGVEPAERGAEAVTRIAGASRESRAGSAIAPISTVATPGYDGIVRLWSLRTGRQLPLLGHAGPVTGVAFGGGGTLASSSMDGTVRLWDVATGEPITTLSHVSKPVWSVAFSRDGQRITTADDDQSARIFTCPVCGSGPVLARAARLRLAR